MAVTRRPAPPGDAGGRPTKYRPKFADLARRLATIGATDSQIAEFLEVSERTLIRWKVDHPPFATALARGKRVANKRVEERLYSRAIGYSHEDVELRVIDGRVAQTPIVRHYPPSVGLLTFWLSNRDPQRWRNAKALTFESPPAQPTEHRHTYGSHELLADHYRVDQGAPDMLATHGGPRDPDPDASSEAGSLSTTEGANNGH